jgi:heat shock protein HslJ
MTKRIAGIIAAALVLIAVGVLAFPRPLTGTTWQLASLDGTPPDAAPITLTFDMTLLGPTLYGNAGCNDYSSGYIRVSSRLVIPGVLRTAMACERPAPSEDVIMVQEARYIDVISDVNRYAVREGQLHLITPDGHTLIYEQAAPDQPGAAPR